MDIANPKAYAVPSSQSLHVYSSPFPPPEVLVKYEQAQSGLIDRII